MDDAHITHIGDVPLDVPIPIAAWQLPEHETHWLANASLDPAKFEDGRFPAFVNENTVEPIEMGMCGGVTHDMLRYTDQARQLIIDTCGVDPYTVEPIPARDISAQLGGMRRRDNTYDSFPHDQAQYGAQRNPARADLPHTD